MAGWSSEWGCATLWLSALLIACGGKFEREGPPPQSGSEPASPEPDPSNVARECATNADCAVVAPCCAPCGTLPAEHAVAVPSDRVLAFRNACRSASADQIPCSGCFRESNPYLVPVCERGTCNVLDLLKEPITACQTGTDCTLRASVCCADEEATFFAVSAESRAELDAILCDGQPPPTNCRVDPPMHQGAVCREHRCSSAFFEP